MTFSIVIPIYNHYDLLHALLFDIYKNCSPVNEVILVDDCSTDLTVVQGIDWWISTGMLPIKYLKMKNNDGFLLTANYGLKKAKSDIVALISTDVRIHKDIVQDITMILNQIQDYLVGGRLLDWETGWNFGHPYLEGWFLCANKYDWEVLGYFDEQYAPNDMEDVDLSTKAKSLGFDLLALHESYLTHLGAQSIPYGTEREELTKINKEKFEKKWIKP